VRKEGEEGTESPIPDPNEPHLPFTGLLRPRAAARDAARDVPVGSCRLEGEGGLRGRKETIDFAASSPPALPSRCFRRDSLEAGLRPLCSSMLSYVHKRTRTLHPRCRSRLLRPRPLPSFRAPLQVPLAPTERSLGAFVRLTRPDSRMRREGRSKGDGDNNAESPYKSFCPVRLRAGC
jgi:hypothetical protein